MTQVLELTNIPEEEGLVVTVIAVEGHKEGSLPISRMANGKIILFEKREPLTYKIRPGDTVECIIKKVKPTYVLVTPIKIWRYESES